MDSVDYEFLNNLSTRLRNFQRKGDSYLASCPICGDSQKNSKKARLYFYEKNGDVFAHCWNECGGMTFYRFLERYDQSLLSDYRAQKFFGSKFKAEEIILSPKVKKETSYDLSAFLNFCSRASDLSCYNSVTNYLQMRQIPDKFFEQILFTDKFKSLTASFGQIIEGKEESRLIIPFFDEQKKVFAFSARSLDKNTQLRYVNIVLDETKPKLFGLDRWNSSEKTYVLEGAFDSMFLLNSLATGGGDIISAIAQFPKENFVVVYDNEPRSTSTRKKIKKAIDNGYSTCIWPQSVVLKDINDMVKSGMKPLDIQSIIDENTFSGLKAKLALGG